MSSPQRKFKFKYEVEFSGWSRGRDDQPTFMEDVITGMLDSLLKIIKMRHPRIKVDIKKSGAFGHRKTGR